MWPLLWTRARRPVQWRSVSCPHHSGGVLQYTQEETLCILNAWTDGDRALDSKRETVQQSQVVKRKNKVQEKRNEERPVRVEGDGGLVLGLSAVSPPHCSLGHGIAESNLNWRVDPDGESATEFRKKKQQKKLLSALCLPSAQLVELTEAGGKSLTRLCTKTELMLFLYKYSVKEVDEQHDLVFREHLFLCLSVMLQPSKQLIQMLMSVGEHDV